MEEKNMAGDVHGWWQGGYPYNYPPCQPAPLYQSWPQQPQITLRDQIAAACLPAIYASMTQLTDRAADLAYEQADEMIRARDQLLPQK